MLLHFTINIMIESKVVIQNAKDLNASGIEL